MTTLIYEWDEAKRRSDLSKHGVDFEAMAAFQWESAHVEPDEYQVEQRWIATSFIGLQLYVAVIAEPGDNRIRVISLRKASRREVKLHVQKHRRA